MANQGVKYQFENTDVMWLLQNHKEKWWEVRNRTGFLPMIEAAQPPRADLQLKHSFPKTPSTALPETDMWPAPGLKSTLPTHPFFQVANQKAPLSS